jgi:hypothetical protein
MEVPRNLGFPNRSSGIALAHSHRKAISEPVQGKSSAEVRRAAAFRVALREFVHESEHATRKARLTPQRYLLLLLVVYVELTDEGDRRFAEAFEALAGERRALRKFVTKL